MVGFGGTADWAALWPATGVIWQFGHLAPVAVTLTGDYLAVSGVDPQAASFTLSLAPLAFAAFTAVFAARSGVRASRAEAWVTGVVTGTIVVAALSTGIALTTAADAAAVALWQAVLFPTIVYAVPAVAAAVATEWAEAGAGAVARLRDRVERHPLGWGHVPALIARGSAAAVAGLVAAGALALTVAVAAGAGEIIALFQAGHVDALGATVITLAQFAYLPTLVIWGVAYIAGPGFALGEGAAVSGAGTQVGVVPGIPILGAVPETSSPWLLLLALAPVAAGVLAGWITRSRVLAHEVDAAGRRPEHEPMGARLAIVGGIAVLSAAAAALLAVVASGSAGPGSLATVGPEPGPVGLAVGLEVGLGAAILLLSPRGRATGDPEPGPETGAASWIDAARADAARADDASPRDAAPVPVPAADPVPAPVPVPAGPSGDDDTVPLDDDLDLLRGPGTSAGEPDNSAGGRG
ncbi:cell division protein PerM [Microbacterium hominis]|uniref:Uncharacterized protein n=1 Tax=Microbacterium hominis TaxID=162426 RepID=A0A7D4Q3M6_9MICO|nr:DUF6350 family protein [Microbacterium hominis]QKJ20151.1 hypothetical protein HQM25_12805 [Microbacterium hominis]